MTRGGVPYGYPDRTALKAQGITSVKALSKDDIGVRVCVRAHVRACARSCVMNIPEAKLA